MQKRTDRLQLIETYISEVKAASAGMLSVREATVSKMSQSSIPRVNP